LVFTFVELIKATQNAFTVVNCPEFMSGMKQSFGSVPSDKIVPVPDGGDKCIWNFVGGKLRYTENTSTFSHLNFITTTLYSTSLYYVTVACYLFGS
jgi:hypothetical protein